MKTGIHYYRYKVCSKYGQAEKIFVRNEHLTATALGIDVRKDEFLNKMSIAKVIAHQEKLAPTIVCRCKNPDCANSGKCACRKSGEFVCHGGRGVNTLRTLCEMED